MFDDRRENYIQRALYDFEMVLREQVDRADKMKDGGFYHCCDINKGITVGLAGGDGIGPVIMSQAEKLLEKLLHEEIKTVFAKKSNELTFENFADLLWKERQSV